MPQNTENVAGPAKRIYEEQLRVSLEMSHMNEFVAIEPISGEHFLGRTLSEAIGASRLKYPGNLQNRHAWTTIAAMSLAVTIALSNAIHAQTVLKRELVIYPAVESETPLDPPLLPTIVNQIRGNAADYYGKGEQNGLFGSPSFSRSLIGADRKTLSELQEDSELRQLSSGGSSLQFLELAARCDSVDWQIDVRGQPIPQLMVAELVQQCRQLGRILSTRARLDVADHDFDSAIRYSQANFALARNVGQGPLIINARVGLGIQDYASSALLDFVQQPQAPSLYWSLAALPHPLLNLDQAYAVELYSLELTFPWIKDVLVERLPSEVWNSRLEKVWDTLVPNPRNRRNVKAPLDELAVFGYPVAKRRLVTNGQLPETIDSLPVAQVLLADMFLQDKKNREAITKWVQFPYSQSLPEIVAVQERQKAMLGFTLDRLTVSAGSDHSILVIAKAFAEQKMAMLQIVEALRLIAADRSELPQSIEGNSYPPCPLDPVSGKPFYYESDGVKAVLEGSAFSRWKNRWEITLASANTEQPVEE